MADEEKEPDEASSRPSGLESDNSREAAEVGHSPAAAAEPAPGKVLDKDKLDADLECSPGTSGLYQEARKRSSSRDSSVNDDPKSINDSISAFSARQMWSSKEMALDGDDPSISSIKGDSISATIADYNRKHRAQTADNQSRTSGGAGLGRLPAETSSKNDNSSVNINLCAASSSTGGLANLCHHTSRPGDFTSVSSNANFDAFNIIEESSDISSSCDAIDRQLAATVAATNAFASQERAGRSRKCRHSAGKQHHHKDGRNKSRRQVSTERTIDCEHELPQEAVYQIEPIVIRGNGNLTLFGLSNSFNSEFPSSLIGRVSREEFECTIKQVNNLLKSQQSLSAKILLCGSLFCCCSFGFSLLWPSITLRKRSKVSLEKLLANENNRLYSKLGLNWKLAEQRCYSNHAFVEYVLMIEFTPKINLYLPD